MFKTISPILVLLVVILVALLLAWGCMCMFAERGPKLGGGEYDDVEGGGTFRLIVSGDEYLRLLDGKKTIEARPNQPPFVRLKEGDPVTIVRHRAKGDTAEFTDGPYKYNTSVLKISKHSSIDALLDKEGLANVYPGRTLKKAKEIYDSFIPQGTEKKEVLAFKLAPPAPGLTAITASPKRTLAAPHRKADFHSSARGHRADYLDEVY